MIVSYSVVHYGVDYLWYALKSIEDLVDACYVFYTPHPSHNHRIDIPPIETEEQIRNSVSDIKKLRWYKTEGIWYEGPQRDYAVNKCVQDGADLILVVDYDEIWRPEVLEQAIKIVQEEKENYHTLINFTHFWRSFNWVCRDQNWPVRFIKPKRKHQGNTFYLPKETGEIYHFGYAIKTETLEYKLKIHGHKNEMRPNWLQDKWLKWPPVDDIHPTNDKNFWNPEPFDKNILPKIMHSHPYFDREII